MLITSSIPNLINGVSQQPPTLRLASQAEAQVNFLSSVADGLVVRPPTRHLAKLDTVAWTDAFLHTINRDVTERYNVVKDKRDHDMLFPKRLSSGNISQVIKMWKHKQEIPPSDEACFHTFRHTTCARMVQRGVPLIVVQAWMGHSVIQTTMRYAHLAPDSLDLALAALNQ